MRTIVISNDQFEALQVQVRIGDKLIAEDNELVYNDLLLFGEEREFSFGVYLFCRCRLTNSEGDETYSKWDQSFGDVSPARPSYDTLDDVKMLVLKFESKKLPIENWGHSEHLVLAIWYEFHYDQFESLELMRTGIIHFNNSVGIPNTASSGYHATITQFWLLAVHCYLRLLRPSSVFAAVQRIMNSALTSKDFPFIFYSRSLLFSTNARLAWYDPDVRPLSELEKILSEDMQRNISSFAR